MKDSYTNIDEFFSDYQKEHSVFPKCSLKDVAHDLVPESKSGVVKDICSTKQDTTPEKLSDILHIVEFPTCETLTNMKPDFGYIYINHVFAEGFLNTLEKMTSYMIARYSLEENLDSYTSHLSDSDPRLKPYFDNIKALEEVPDNDWIHTNYGKYCNDDVIVTGYDERDFRHYYMIWLDRDVSDCCIYKVRKEHYPTFSDFNKAVAEYIRGLGYKINPIRKPDGWVRW